MTEQPQEPITRGQADVILQQWEAELGSDEQTQSCARQQVDELFRHHNYPPWLAVQYFVACADRTVEGSSNPYQERLSALQV